MKYLYNVVITIVILLTAAFFAAIIATENGRSGESGESAEIRAKPSVYVTRTSHGNTFEGNEIWILEYTIEGKLQTPVFDSQDAMEAYCAYLHTISRVYQKEEEECR